MERTFLLSGWLPLLMIILKNHSKWPGFGEELEAWKSKDSYGESSLSIDQHKVSRQESWIQTLPHK